MKAILWILSGLAGALVVLFFVGRRRIAEVEPIDPGDVAPAPGGKFVQTRSGRVHCLEVGDGTPVLLFHGSGRSTADWQEGVVDLLAEHHRVIAFDYYGCGLSERHPKFTYGYHIWIQQAIDLLDALGIERVTAVGHSVGGALALMVASKHPSRIDHVVTIGTGFAIEPAQFLPVIPGVGEMLMSRATMFGPGVSPQNRAALEAAFRIRGTRAALLTYIRRQMTIDGISAMLRGTVWKVLAPVLHLSGSEDRNIPPAAARSLARMTHGTFVLVPGATHMLHCEKPREVTEAIEHFLAR